MSSLKKLKKLNPYLYKLIKDSNTNIKRHPDMIKRISDKYVEMINKRNK